MSIGNLKTYGNKGNNFPFQLKVLQGITDLINSLTGVTTGASRVTNISRPTAAYSASISNVGTADGTVKATTLKPGETVNFDAGAINNTLDAIDYDATGTEFLIIFIS